MSSGCARLLHPSEDSICIRMEPSVVTIWRFSRRDCKYDPTSDWVFAKRIAELIVLIFGNSDNIITILICKIKECRSIYYCRGMNCVYVEEVYYSSKTQWIFNVKLSNIFLNTNPYPNVSPVSWPEARLGGAASKALLQQPVRKTYVSLLATIESLSRTHILHFNRKWSSIMADTV